MHVGLERVNEVAELGQQSVTKILTKRRTDKERSIIRIVIYEEIENFRRAALP